MTPVKSDQPDEREIDVLLVEDNPGDARLLQEYLSEAAPFDAAPERVDTLEAALGCLRDRASPPHVVLLDLGLPDAAGLEAVQAVVEAAPELPVIVLTGRDDRRAAVEALREGAEDYLLKGEVGPGVLARSIRYAIERKRAERELEVERARLQEVFREAPAFLAVMRGPEHVFEMANPTYRELVGDREMVGRTVRDVLPDLEGQPFFGILDEVYRTAEPYRGDEVPIELDRGDGRERRFLSFVYQPLIENGETTGVLAHGVDVTEQVERRREAEDRKAKLDRILETSADGILLANTDGEFTFANPAAEEMLGLEASEIAARTYNDPKWGVCGPDGGGFPDEELPVARVLRTGEPVRGVEHGVERPNGDRRVLSVHAAPLDSPDGELQGVVASLRDVTEKKERERALRRSEARYRTLVETMAEATVIVDPDGRITFANEEAQELIGLEESEPSDVRNDDPRWEIEALDGSPFPEDELPFRQVMGTGGPIRDAEVAFQPSTGERMILSVNAAPLGDRDGEPAAVVATMRDVTEIRQARLALEQAREMFKGVFETSPVALKIVDAETHEYRTVNEGFTD